MAFSKHTGSEIIGLVNVMPSQFEDNLELDLLSEQERTALVNHTGIRFRRIAPKDVTIRDLFERAIDRLLEKTGWEKETIDVLICVTQSPEMIIPSVSCRLHGDMHFSTHTMCFDINSGCSGFVYGLNTVSALLSGISQNSRAILCCGDLSTHLIDPSDKSVRPIFSDGVSAIAIERTIENTEVTGYFNLGTDGSGQHAIEMQTDANDAEYMKLNGIDVFGYSVKLVPDNIQQLLQFANQKIDFPDWFVFHQANKLINESIRKKIGVEEAKVPYSIHEFGNTASASIPFTLGLNWKNYPSHNQWILVSGFGVGFSVASALIKFNPQFCDAPIEFP
jgi:3-oxoacyl-[acyl-carrier-protein] synthase-3